MANLKKQVRKVLSSKIAYGVSKHKANRDGTASDKIFSSSSFKSYLKVGNRYAAYVKEIAPDCRSLKAAYDAGYAHDYIDNMIERKLSPFTIAQARSTLAKLHGVDGDMIHGNIPRRVSKNITRSRRPIERDLRLQERYPDLYDAARSCGLRAYKELSCVTPNDIHIAEDGSVRITGVRGKGGRLRDVDVLGHEDLWKRLKESFPASSPIFSDIPHNSSLHACRAEYATALYQKIARPISELEGHRIRVADKRTGRTYDYPAVYRTKDGRALDRQALIDVSLQLGHGVSRAYCVATSYVRG